MKRLFGAAGVCASAVCAGTMASRSGSPSVTPAPFRNVRRGMRLFVMIMMMSARGPAEAGHDEYHTDPTHDPAEAGHYEY